MKYYVINIIKDVKGTVRKSIVSVVSEEDYKGRNTKTYITEFSSKKEAEQWAKTLREEDVK